MCAASPAKKTRPTRNALVMRRWMRYLDTQRVAVIFALTTLCSSKICWMSSPVSSSLPSNSLGIRAMMRYWLSE